MTQPIKFQKSPQNHQKRKRFYKTLGTSVIKQPNIPTILEKKIVPLKYNLSGRKFDILKSRKNLEDNDSKKIQKENI